MTTTVLRSATIAGILLLTVPLSVTAGVTTYQTADAIDIGTGDPVGGAATLFRSKHAVDVRIATTGLDTGAAYSVWWVVFNNPAACVGGCGADDLGNPAVRASVFYAAGFVTGPEGTGNLTAHVDAGPPAQGADVLQGKGLEVSNGFGAEIHMVVRTHGPIIPGRVDEQIGSFNGACEVNTCANQQAAVFLAPRVPFLAVP